MSKISIALCTYNGAEFLKQQLESYIIQTKLPDEVVIGDDCSTDETVEIIEEFKQKSPFPVYLHINEKNLGSTENFERTILRCTGDIIYLSDQDDIWLPEKIAVIEEVFAANSDVGLVFSDAALIDEKGKLLKSNLWDFTFTKRERNYLNNGKSLEVLLKRNVVTGATTAFRTELSSLFTPIDKTIPDLIHDGWIAIIAVLYSRITFVNKCLILYRQHENQQLGVDWKTKKKITVDLLFKFSRKTEDRSKYFNRSIGNVHKEIDRFNETIKFLKNRELSKNSSDIFEKLNQESLAEKLNQIAHLEVRRELPKNRLKRIYPITKEIFTKRYHIYSRGIYGIGRDFFEKWK
ncbi:MAG: glycosyltransferase family 2 protein [Aridibacter sp.]